MFNNLTANLSKNYFKDTDFPTFRTFDMRYGEYHIIVNRSAAWLSTFVGKVQVFKNGELYSTNVHTAVNIINSHRK